MLISWKKISYHIAYMYLILILLWNLRLKETQIEAALSFYHAFSYNKSPKA
jgi:hypothetical protein